MTPSDEGDSSPGEWMRRLLVLPEQASTIADDIDALHYFVITVTMIGAVSVALLAGWFVIRYRRKARPGPPDQPAKYFIVPVWLEVGLIGGLMLLFIGWWWIGVRQYMHMRVPPPDAEEVYVLGKQWMFKFSHPSGVSTVDTLYVPVGRPVKLVMTSRDVIHSFYVPEFRVKQDLVPGRYTTVWFEPDRTGVFDILCAEFCGTGHSQMRGQVVVLSPSDYEEWLETAPSEELEPGDPREGLALVDMGEVVAAQRGCLRCHTTDGSPHIGPSFAGLHGATIPLQDGGEIVADEAYLTESMMDPLAHVHAGFTPVMPSYKGMLEPAEVAALLELIESLRAPVPARAYPPPQAQGTPAYPVPEGSTP